MKIQFCNGDKLNVLHFQHNIYDFGNGYCEVLEQEDFHQNLKQYIKRLFDLGHKEIIFNILNKLETCVIEHNNRRLRFKALGIIFNFSSLLNGQKDKDFFHIVVNILTRWISKEPAIPSRTQKSGKYHFSFIETCNYPYAKHLNVSCKVA